MIVKQKIRGRNKKQIIFIDADKHLIDSKNQ